MMAIHDIRLIKKWFSSADCLGSFQEVRGSTVIRCRPDKVITNHMILTEMRLWEWLRYSSSSLSPLLPLFPAGNETDRKWMDLYSKEEGRLGRYLIMKGEAGSLAVGTDNRRHTRRMLPTAMKVCWARAVRSVSHSVFLWIFSKSDGSDDIPIERLHWSIGVSPLGTRDDFRDEMKMIWIERVSLSLSLSPHAAAVIFRKATKNWSKNFLDLTCLLDLSVKRSLIKKEARDESGGGGWWGRERRRRNLHSFQLSHWAEACDCRPFSVLSVSQFYGWDIEWILNHFYPLNWLLVL